MGLAIVTFIAVAIIVFIVINKRRTPPVITKVEAVTYKGLLNTHVGFYQKLNDKDKIRFEQQVQSFLQTVNIEGAGTEVTDLDRMLIAASAVIPIFGFPGWEYQNLTSVVLYPDAFNNDFQFEGEANRNILGMVGSGYMNGQMLLSRLALIKGFSKQSGKENAAIHEFVHLVDKTDGAVDGIPETVIGDNDYTTPWLKMMHQEMHRIEAGKSDINPYALTNEAEFLAVVSEYFFEKPAQLEAKHPELYEQLSQFFMQKPG
jgi:Mlc titration factor MtfA (ptsG expression regulator)